jgi:hypothetical protein
MACPQRPESAGRLAGLIRVWSKKQQGGGKKCLDRIQKKIQTTSMRSWQGLVDNKPDKDDIRVTIHGWASFNATDSYWEKHTEKMTEVALGKGQVRGRNMLRSNTNIGSPANIRKKAGVCSSRPKSFSR